MEFIFEDNLLKITCKPIEDEKFDVFLYIPPEYKADKTLVSLGDNLYKFTCDKEKYIFEMER